MARRTTGKSAPDGWSELHGWISAYLSEKTTPRKIVAWCSWANNRRREGWTNQQVEDRIRESWRLHAFGRDENTLSADLKASLEEVYKAAEGGWSPAQCAVVYRSLYRVHPTRHWLQEWADRWEQAGSDWRNVVLP